MGVCRWRVRLRNRRDDRTMTSRVVRTSSRSAYVEATPGAASPSVLDRCEGTASRQRSIPTVRYVDVVWWSLHLVTVGITLTTRARRVVACGSGARHHSIIMTSGWLLPIPSLVLAFAAVVGLLALRRYRRRLALHRAAQGLGLEVRRGRPARPRTRPRAPTISETVWGRFDGADVAVATASRPRVRRRQPSGRPSRSASA